MLLTYDAVDARGRTSSDSIEAGTVRDAVDQLRKRGLYVRQIREPRGSPRSLRRTPPADVTAAIRLPLKVLVQITRQLAMLLRAGTGVVPALAAIQRQQRCAGHARLLGRVIADLEDGATLTDAIRKHPRSFDPVYSAIVAAGEASGTLTAMFDRLATIVGKRRALRKKILGAMAYPALLIMMCLKIFLVLLFFVLPRFGDMFLQLGAPIPATTQLLLDTASALRSYWPVVIGVAALAIAGIVWTLRSRAGRQWLADVQLQIPLVGRLRSRLIQGQIFRTLGMLLESRVDVLEAIALVRDSTGSRRFQRLFDDLVQVVTSGGRLSTAFDGSGLVDPYICEGIRTGEETGNLGGSMSYCADMLDESNEELINVLTKLTEPAILIGMGAFVGGVALSLFVPLFDMTSAVR